MIKDFVSAHPETSVKVLIWGICIILAGLLAVLIIAWRNIALLFAKDRLREVNKLMASGMTKEESEKFISDQYKSLRSQFGRHNKKRALVEILIIAAILIIYLIGKAYSQ